MTYVAVDVDGTLTRSNISFLFGMFLYKKGVLPFFSALWLAFLYFLHKSGVISLQSLHAKVFSFLFQGKRFSFFDKIADEFFALHPAIFRQEVLADVLERQKRGQRVVLLSASPDFLIKKLVNSFSFQEWYATEYFLDEKGVFSTLGRIMTGEEKAFLVKKACEGSKERIVAMTDSVLDLPLLSIADDVFIVAPCRALLKEARKKNWRVIA